MADLIACVFSLQVVFLPGFGCLYIDVSYEKGTLVLSLAPEGSMDPVINQHSRYNCVLLLPVMLLTYFNNKAVVC